MDIKQLLLRIDWRTVLFFAFCIITIIQLYFYLYFFRRLAYFSETEKQQSQQHPVSVIVCARDEAPNLARNLPGLLAQTYPTTHEIIVVNHNSQDETRYLLEEFKKTFKDLHIVNLQQEAKGIPGKKYPLSMGIKESRHEIILLTDADCVPATEFWIHRMQDGFENGIEVVLGYGGYNKRPGFLNKLIRFETFHSAVQYLSFALAGRPYMGVGRNLSYKKDLFLKNKGFSSINHIPGGDDDLFINKVSNKNNTRVVIHPDAITLSEPKKKFGDWIRQKNRHFTTSKYYKSSHKFLLGLYSFSHFLFYPLFVLSLVFFDWRWTVPVFAVRFIAQAVIYNKSMKKLNEGDLFGWWIILDIWMFIYYLIFAPALWKRPKKSWN
jgi:cellulose synthase/poly-beta-1,6-N-acetylglucosamine synthase-like glycosyltransferase